MRARFSSTHLLLICLAGLSAWFFLYENQYKQKQQELKTQELSLLPFEKDSITELIITQKEGPAVHLKKGSEEEWLLIEPISDQADNQTVNQLLSALDSAKNERTVEEAPKYLTPFGLDKPEVKIKAIKDLNNQVELLLGIPTQVGAGLYAKLASDSKVIKTTKSLTTSFQKTLFELRNKKLISLKRNLVSEIELEFAGKKVFFVKDSSTGNWQLGRLGAPVKLTQWSKVENKIFNLSAQAVFAESPDEALSTLFQNARLILNLKVNSNDPVKALKEKVLLVEQSGKTLAQVEGRSPIYELSKGLIQELSQPEETYRDKHILAFEQNSISRIKFSHQGKKFELLKDQDKWRFDPAVDPNEVVDSNKVDNFLRETKEVQVQEFLSRQASLQTTSAIEFLDAQEKVMGRIELGSSQKDLVRGKSSYQPSPWTLSKKTFGTLKLVKEDFIKQKEKPNDSVTH